MMNPLEKNLLRLHGFRILLNQVLEDMLGRTMTGVEAFPRGTDLKIKIHSVPVAPELSKRVSDRCLQLVRDYFENWSCTISFEGPTQDTAKSIFNNLMDRKDQRLVMGKRENIFSITRYPLKKYLQKGVRGIQVYVRGKKGLRTSVSSAVCGKILRGTKLHDRKDKYVGQYLDRGGTTGVTVLLIKNLPPALRPRLIINDQLRSRTKTQLLNQVTKYDRVKVIDSRSGKE